MNLKPIVTEKAIMKVETENILTFFVEQKTTKQEIKKEVEDLFKVKVEKIRTNIRNNKKIAYVKLNKKYLAIDVATKLGLM
jgi:ribosomal protein L23